MMFSSKKAMPIKNGVTVNKWQNCNLWINYPFHFKVQKYYAATHSLTRHKWDADDTSR